MVAWTPRIIKTSSTNELITARASLYSEVIQLSMAKVNELKQSGNTLEVHEAVQTTNVKSISSLYGILARIHVEIKSRIPSYDFLPDNPTDKEIRINNLITKSGHVIRLRI